MRWLAMIGLSSLLSAVYACGDAEDNAGTVTTSGGSTAVTYHEHVAPILAKHCSGCHDAGGIAPFALSTYADVASSARAIESATADRRMPPWPADNSGACNTWRDARWLSEDELTTIAEWVKAGAPEGDPALATDPPGPPAGLDAVSSTFDMGVDYTPDSQLTDDYRCFVIDPGLATSKFLTAYHVKPGNLAGVHHVLLFALESDQGSATVEQRDAAESGPGYTCFGGPGASSHLVAGWAPGTPATPFPSGTGLEIAPNRKLVMQVHYNLANGAAPDRTTIDVTLADEVAKPAKVVLLSDHAIVLPPKLADATAGTTMNVAAGATVHGMFPHMHQRGTSIRVDRLSGGETSCMVDIPRWDFHWQQFYFYEKPIEVKAGDALAVECHYDTKNETNTVTFGEGTGDEMCLNFFYVTLGGDACASCSEVVLGNANPKEICASAAAPLSALAACVCDQHCMNECGTNICAGKSLSGPCQSCIQSSCGAELAACLDNL